jgi:hypothetical protein
MRLRTIGLVTMCIGMAPLGFLQAGLLGELLGGAGAVLALAFAGLLALAAVLRLWPELLRSIP